jgi:hypothetical protein
MDQLWSSGDNSIENFTFMAKAITQEFILCKIAEGLKMRIKK